MVYCQYCGKLVQEEGERFCKYCGKSLTEPWKPSPSQQPQTSQNAAVPSNQRARNTIFKGVNITSFIYGVLFGIWGFILYNIVTFQLQNKLFEEYTWIFYFLIATIIIVIYRYLFFRKKSKKSPTQSTIKQGETVAKKIIYGLSAAIIIAILIFATFNLTILTPIQSGTGTSHQRGNHVQVSGTISGSLSAQSSSINFENMQPNNHTINATVPFINRHYSVVLFGGLYYNAYVYSSNGTKLGAYDIYVPSAVTTYKIDFVLDKGATV